MAVNEEPKLEDALADLSARTRRKRQDAAHVIRVVAQAHPDLLVGHVDELIDALDTPEPQTRLDLLDALEALGKEDPALIKKAVDAAEDSLFDEQSSSVRLAAFRMLIEFGSTGAEASEIVWPSVDEAIQCFHGNPEYRDMLVALVGFASADIAPEVKEALAERVSFDAQNMGAGYIKAYSQEIIDAASK
jgi:hypothetical protein